MANASTDRPLTLMEGRAEKSSLTGSRVLDLVALVVLVLSAVAIFIYFLRPPAFGDQLDYFYYAYNIEEARPGHRHLRIGLMFPVWLVSRIFGYSELSYYFMPMVGALSLSVGTFLLGRLLFNVWVGFFAGILVIFNPWVLRDLTHLVPDFVSAGLLTLALVVLIWLGQRGELQAVRYSRRTVAWLFLSGLLVGWSYLAREYVVVLFPVIVLTVLALRARFLPSLVPLGTGAFLVWTIELAWGWIRFDNPLIRLFAVSSPRQTEAVVALDPRDIVMQLPDLLLAAPGGWFFAGLLGLGLVGSIVLAIAGNRRWQTVAVWLAFGWLFFTVIALLPILILGEDRVYLRMHKFRYWGLILPPLMVGGLGVLHLLAQGAGMLASARWRPHASQALIVFLSAVVTWCSIQAVSGIAGSGVFVRNGSNGYQAFREHMRKHGAGHDVLLLNRQVHIVASSVSLPIYLTEWHGLSRVWTGEIREYDLAELPAILDDEEGGGLLAIDRTRLPVLLSRSTPPDEFLFPEQYGRMLFSSQGGNVVVIDMGSEAPEREQYTASAENAWQFRPVGLSRAVEDAVVAADGGYEIRLDAGERLFATVDQWVSSQSGSEGLRVSQDAFVIGALALTTADLSGRLFARCVFDVQGSQPMRRIAPIMAEEDDDPTAQLARFSCPPPDEGGAGSTHAVAIEFDLIGPLDLRLGELTLEVGPGL